MAGLKIQELRGEAEAELRQKIDQSRKELAALRLRGSQGALEQPHQIPALRRNIARIMTVLREQASSRKAS